MSTTTVQNALVKQLKTPGGSWDAKRVAGLFVGVGIFLGIAALFTKYVLPMLLTMTWGLIQLVIGGVILAFLAYIFLNPKTWRGIRYLTEAISQWLLGWAIEMNPFNILQLKIESARKDREQLKEHGALLKGQADNLQDQVDTNGEEMRLAAASVKILENRGQSTWNDDDIELHEIKVNEFQNAKSFIDGVQPILNDLKKLVAFADKAYRKSGIALTTAENTLTKQRALYAAVTTGSATMSKAMRAFAGDANLNSDADLALKYLKDDISNKIGLIQSSIQITSTLMNKRDLEDAAKVSLSAELASKFDDNAFEYAEVITENRVVGNAVNTSNNNKYLDLLNTKKNS